MDKNTIETVGAVTNYYTTPVSTAPLIQNISEGNAINAAVSSLQAAGGVWEMFGKQLPSLHLAGRSIPVGGMALGGAGLVTDITNMSDTYNATGKVQASDIYSAASNISAIAGAAAMAGAAAAASPALLIGAGLLAVGGAALTVMSMHESSEVDVDALMKDLKESYDELSDSIGDVFQEIGNVISDRLTDARDFVEWLKDTAQDAFAKLMEEIEDGFEFIGDKVNDLYNDARNWVQRSDPLTLDLDGDGLETTGIDSANPILFDHDGDGTANATGWVKPDDGYLVLDRNENGLIDNGTELFGDSTPLLDENGDVVGQAADGFAALAAEDTNGDGIVDANDANWDKLRVWQDLNSDGKTDEGELKTLEELGVAGFHVAKEENNQVLANGNAIADLGSYIKTDGSEGALGEVTGNMADIDLADNPFYRKFDDSIPLTEQAEALPNMQGTDNTNPKQSKRTLFRDISQIWMAKKRLQ